MGLPMWKEPEDESVIEDAAAKLDRAAAARRSAIRREQTVRPRDSAPTQSISRFLRDHRYTSSRSSERTEAQIAALQVELDTLRRLRQHHTNVAARMRARTQMSDFSERDETLADELSSGRPETAVEPADTIRQHLPRPPRESALRFEVLPAATSRSSSPWRYQVLSRSFPSPPHSASEDRQDRSIPDGPIPDGPLPSDLDMNAMPALTEGFAPAQVVSTSRDRNSEPHDDVDTQLETPPPESWELSYPPLRRVSRMSPRPLPRVDGLGDRRRSPSPLSDSHEEETWANLLTTMETSRSSTATSFASNHSESHPRSGRSSQNTSTSFGEIGLIDDTCDLDLPPGITEEEVLELRARHRPRNHHRMTGRRGLQEHQDRIAGRAEISMFRAILERMQRREDVPDDWWATVGVNPDFGRS